MAWLVEFRHPLKPDSNNRPGRKTRKGLGTSDQAEASKLVAQLNLLLADESLWSPAARAQALVKFDPRVVEIFFSEIEARSTSPIQLRDLELPLPGTSEGYAKAVLLGIPGAGKTTILRQLLGTDPLRERFPSTSVNRTTTFPLEVATSYEDFHAVVTFMSEHEVRFEVEECVSAAIVEAVFRRRKEIAQTLLEKSDMRFRLKYLLGDISDSEAEEEDAYDEVEESEPSPFDIVVADPSALQSVVDDFVDRVMILAGRLRARVEEGQGSLENLSFEDRNAALDLVEEQAQEDDAFLELVSDIVEEIGNKFFNVSAGRFQKTTSGWPKSWSVQMPVEDRAQFFRLLKYFSGIAKPSWGNLLTPVVNGMRVFGPFKPLWSDAAPKFVLFDTEGLGHKASVTAELPEQLFPVLNEADVILLVDSAKSGMNIAAGKALEGIVNAGHTRKTSIVFTHMDAVRGDNLKGNAKYDHVFMGLRNVVENQVAKNVSPEAARFLMDRLRSNTFYVGKIHELDPAPARKELQRLFLHLVNAKAPVFVPVGLPYYNPDNVVLAVQKAVSSFRHTWQAYLGIVSDPSLKPKPWQTVKALSRRYAQKFDDGFVLRPTSDLVSSLSASFSQLLENPMSWTGEPTPDQRREAIDYLKTAVTNALPLFSAVRLKENPHPQWVDAYALKGFGSTLARRMRIEELLQSVLPIPDPAGDKEVFKLIEELKGIVADASAELSAKMSVSA
jgi:hypothetical protein